MKTVSGTIVSSKPINLSKAANILSNFVSSDNGASQSVSTYLRRTSAAFNELVYFKKHHMRKKHRPMEESSSKSDINPRNIEEDAVRVLNKFDLDPVEIDEKNGNVEDKLDKKEKKKKEKKEKSKGSLGNGEFEEDNEIVKENGEEKKEKKKKSKGSLGNGEFEEDNEIVKEKSEEKKKKKKRKNAEAEGDEISNSKKKRRRIEVDDE